MTRARQAATWLICLTAAQAGHAQPQKANSPPATPGVTIANNVAYLPTDRTEKADLYLPEKRIKGERSPAVVIIHGGGWTGGDKAAAREINIGTNLALRGYVALSINYALATKEKATWPQNLHDCMAAVRWLRKNADRLQIHPERIGAIGGSAGGHLAAMLAVLGPGDGLDPKEPYGEFSCRVQCAVDLYGPADLTRRESLAMLGKSRADAPELYRAASPTTYVRKTTPPILIVHGTADKTVDVKESERFAEVLKKAGAVHELVIVEGAPHTFHLQPSQRDLRPVVLGFFDKHLKAAAAKDAEQYGAKRSTIEIGMHKGFILHPAKPATEESRPWVWYAPTIGSHPNKSNEWVLKKLLDRGTYVAGINVGESFGSPAGRKIFTDFHQHVVKEFKLENKARLLAQSRGGLMLYNWAAENPDKVRCIVGIYPVCDLRSYPGLDRAAGAYGLTPAKLEEQLSQHNPIDRLEPLAKAGIPILHVHGDKDTVVPLDKNSQVLFDRYRKLGGKMDLIVVPGKGHAEAAEFFQEPRLVQFLLVGKRAKESSSSE